MLAGHGVDFIVVGGVAAVLGGAPISTFDLDIVHARDPDLVRLVAALGDLDARYRDPAGRVLRADAAGLAGNGHHLLMTRCGPVDVLAASVTVRATRSSSTNRSRDHSVGSRSGCSGSRP